MVGWRYDCAHWFKCDCTTDEEAVCDVTGKTKKERFGKGLSMAVCFKPVGKSEV